MILVVGLGAWIGLPTVLKPVEKVASIFGADLNEVPGYVDLKHTFTRLKTDDWIALDEGSWFYMPSLYPAASFSQAMQVLQTQDVMLKPRDQRRAGVSERNVWDETSVMFGMKSTRLPPCPESRQLHRR